MTSRWTPVTRTKTCCLVSSLLFTLVIFILLFPTLFTRYQKHSVDLATPTNTQLGISAPPITPRPFTPFPVPSDTPIPGTFPETRPQNPPDVSESGKVVPDFGEAWKSAHSKAKSLIADWSLQDKVDAVTGVGWQGGLCVGNIKKIRDFPGLCLEVCLFYPSISLNSYVNYVCRMHPSESEM